MGYYRRIRDLREDHDLTQRQLAAKLGMTQTQYFRYEQGYRDVPSDILIALADLYQTSTDYLLGRTDRPDQNTDGTTYFPRHPCVGFQGRT